MKIEINDQLYINNKWFWDVISIDKDLVEVRIKYKESINSKFYLYKIIKLPLQLFDNCQDLGIIKTCQINDIQLKSNIGSLINRLVKERNIYALIENVNAANTSGMGSVAIPSMSGIPGVSGSAGSGDVNGHVVFGGEKIPAHNLKGIDIHLKDKKKKKKAAIKNPILNVLKENSDVEFESEVQVETENQFKLKLFEFLDYPRNNDIDISIIKSISIYRNTFKSISNERILTYLNDFYKLNKTTIDNKASEQLKNQLLNLIS